MNFDIFSEELISLKQAAKRTPGAPHISTLVRWMQKGVRGVRLETCKIGGKRFTSVEALERFFVGQAAAEEGKPSPNRTPTQRKRSIEQAEAELQRITGRTVSTPA